MELCPFCLNARICSELTEYTDFSSYSVGFSEKGFRIMFNSGFGSPPRLQFEFLSFHGWEAVGIYFLKYCPVCGRKISEYDFELEKGE